MAKSREKTQQLGFWDAEVSSSDHDGIVLWAYKNAEMIVRKVRPELFNHPWLVEEVNLGLAHADRPETKEERRSLAKAFTEANPRPNPRVIRKTLEYVLKAYTGHQNKLERIVGYADLLIETEVACVTPVWVERPNYHSEGMAFDHFQITWTDRPPAATPYNRAPRVLVEAKSELPTVGELMRQIQLYRTAFKGEFVVVSPDEKYKDILADQGVIFIKYGD